MSRSKIYIREKIESRSQPTLNISLHLEDFLCFNSLLGWNEKDAAAAKEQINRLTQYPKLTLGGTSMTNSAVPMTMTMAMVNGSVVGPEAISLLFFVTLLANKILFWMHCWCTQRKQTNDKVWAEKEEENAKWLTDISYKLRITFTSNLGEGINFGWNF